MQAARSQSRRGRPALKAFDLETFKAVVKRRALIAADPSLAGLRPPSISQVCAMVARETGRSTSTVRARYYANPLRAVCEALDPQGAQLIANGSLAPLDSIAAALPSVTVMGWREAPSFMRAISHRLESGGQCQAPTAFIDDLAPDAQWALAQMVRIDGEWPEVLLVADADSALLMADAFHSLPGVNWIHCEPPEALTTLVPLIVTPCLSVPGPLLSHDAD